MARSTRAASLRGLGLLVAVFAAGVLAGSSLSMAGRGPVSDPPADSAVVSVEGDPFEALGLSIEQRVAVDSILAAMGSLADSVLSDSREALVAEAERAKNAIRSELTEGQAVRFDSVLKDLGGLKMRVARRMVVSDSLPGGVDP